MAGDIRAGGAYVEIGAKLGSLEKGLKSGLSKIGNFSKSAAVKMAVLNQSFEFLKKASAPIAKLATQFAQVGDNAAKAAKRMGVSSSFVSELGYAAELSGASMADVEKGVRRMSQAVADPTARKAIERLGFSMGEMAGKSNEQRFTILGEKITALKDPAERTAAAMQIFGRAGTALLPMFGDGPGALQAMREEAQKLGISIGPEQAKAAEALTDAWTRTKKAIQGVAIFIGGKLAPVMEWIANLVTGVSVRVREWMGDIKTISDLSAKIGEAWSALSSGIIMPLWDSLKTVLTAAFDFAVGLIVPLFKMVTSQFPGVVDSLFVALQNMIDKLMGWFAGQMARTVEALASTKIGKRLGLGGLGKSLRDMQGGFAGNIDDRNASLEGRRRDRGAAGMDEFLTAMSSLSDAFGTRIKEGVSPNLARVADTFRGLGFASDVASKAGAGEAMDALSPETEERGSRFDLSKRGVFAYTGGVSARAMRGLGSQTLEKISRNQLNELKAIRRNLEQPFQAAFA